MHQFILSFLYGRHIVDIKYPNGNPMIFNSIDEAMTYRNKGDHMLSLPDIRDVKYSITNCFIRVLER